MPHCGTWPTTSARYLTQYPPVPKVRVRISVPYPSLSCRPANSRLSSLHIGVTVTFECWPVVPR